MTCNDDSDCVEHEAFVEERLVISKISFGLYFGASTKQLKFELKFVSFQVI